MLFKIIPIASAAFFLLGGYEFVRSASNTLFKLAYGSENLPSVLMLVPLLTWLTLYAYGFVLSFFGPKKTLLLSTFVSGIILAGCYYGIALQHPIASALLFIWREIYVVILIEQYWSYLDSILGEQAAKKWNGFICGVASLGSVLGGFLVQHWALRSGSLAMILWGALSLVPAGLCAYSAFIFYGEPKPTNNPLEGKTGYLALGLFKKSKFLCLLLLLIMITQVVSVALSLHFQFALEASFQNPDEQTAFSGGFFAWVAIVAAFLQFVAAPIVLKYWPLWRLQLLIPCLHIVLIALAVMQPQLHTIGLAYFMFKSLDYSLFRASKEILYIPLTYDTRYRAKEVIDVLGYRAGKGGMSLIFMVIKQLGVHLITRTYAIFALVAAVGWLLLITVMARFKHKPVA